ncbi:hypothetical protein BS47DRAFT_398932 [Hydnum rufescens UP504]|uniref:Transmembrane protein n=1 Tax=Hydnum rufescens UP504 TaxID=1448309 RepID=A0A9P6BCB5_9AGAM|nr:hypothetical protein BS47DRAFT_398932 [Hydnum rufescens UP504]
MTSKGTLQAPPAYSPEAQAASGPSAATTVTYGPTPIVAYYPHHHQGDSPAAAVYLPYYDPSSQHSQERAERRARQRFFGAILWAVVVYALTGMMFGSLVAHGHRR